MHDNTENWKGAKMKLKKTTFYSIALLLAGCVPSSLHPLYNDQTLIFREELIGKWMEDDGGIWQFRQAGEEEYELRMCEDGQEIGRFAAHLIEIEGLMFLDLLPDLTALEEMDYFSQMHILPVHTFIKVDQIEPSLGLRMIDYDQMTEILEDDPEALKHEIVEDRVVLTAPTEELQRFVIKYVETIFDDGSDEMDNTSNIIRIEPLYTEEDIVFDTNLTGLWETTDGTLDSQQLEENIYDLIFAENDGTTQQLYANLITCSDEVFMAVFADVDELEPAESSAYAFHLMPDWFWRVERTDTELKLEQMDYEEVSKMLRKENSPLAAQRKNASYRFKGTRIER